MISVTFHATRPYETEITDKTVFYYRGKVLIQLRKDKSPLRSDGGMNKILLPSIVTIDSNAEYSPDLIRYTIFLVNKYDISSMRPIPRKTNESCSTNSYY